MCEPTPFSEVAAGTDATVSSAGGRSARRFAASRDFGDGVQQFVPGLLELVDALGLQHLVDVVSVDADRLQGGEDRGGRAVGAVDGVAADDAVVGDRVDGLLRRGVDGVRGDQFDDVPGVVVGGVLDAGGGPQRALLVRAGGLQRVPRVAGELLLVELVGQPGVGDRGLARAVLQPRGCRCSSSRLSISVSTRETKNEATEWILVRSGRSPWPAPARQVRRRSRARSARARRSA